MELVFVHGPAASGKLTVATALADLTGFRLFHNHLTVDLVLALFPFGTEPFVRLREEVWLRAFTEAARASQSLIFTFQPEASVSPAFVENVIAAITGEGGTVHFVQLLCAEEVIETRIESKSRTKFLKLSSLEQYQQLRDSGAFAYPPLPKPLVTVETGLLPPEAAAATIKAALDSVAH